MVTLATKSRIEFLVAPSFQEGQPLTVLEAMSHGCCIVAGDIAAHKEVIGDAGVLYPVRDPAALADALHRVLTDDNLRAALGARARDEVEQRDELSWDRAAESTEAVLESLTTS